MISVSSNANPNYLAKIVELSNLEKHPNAERLQISKIDFQNVIMGTDAKVGDLYVFFPLESQINADLLSFTNSFRDKELNQNKEAAGFFEKRGRVRAVKLRGEKSMGYAVPLTQVEEFIGKNLKEYVGQEFDTIGDILMVKKFTNFVNGCPKNLKKGKKPQVSRLDESLPNVIICDLDGTLAIHNGRSPYDYDKCDTDLPNKPLINLLENCLSYGQVNIIFMSGREDSCKEKTKQWIKKHIQIMDKEFKLYMRKTGDFRKDTVVKKELFEQHIKNKYYVEFVLDDRNCVVEMWRGLGLTCLQCANGDF